MFTTALINGSYILCICSRRRQITLVHVNVYVDLVVFTRIAGTFFIFFKINSFRNTIRASNSLYPYQQAPRLHNFFMLNSDEREIYPVHTCYFPTIVGILTFISKINTTFEWHKVRHFFICRYFRIYEKLKFRPWFSLA